MNFQISDQALSASTIQRRIAFLAIVQQAREALFPVNRDIFRRVDADPNLVAFDTEYGDRDLFSNHQGFTNPPGQNQHTPPSLAFRPHPRAIPCADAVWRISALM